MRKSRRTGSPVSAEQPSLVYVGIDVSKATLVVTLLCPQTKKTLLQDEVPNTQDGIALLLALIIARSVNRRVSVHRVGELRERNIGGRKLILSQPSCKRTPELIELGFEVPCVLKDYEGDDTAIKFFIIQNRSINPEREILEQVAEIEREKWIQGVKTGSAPDPQAVCQEWASKYSAGWRAHRVTSIVYVFEREKDRVDPPLRSREELAYFRIFREHLPGIHPERTVSRFATT